MSDENNGATGGAGPAWEMPEGPRLDQVALAKLASDACAQLRAAGVDSVVVAVHCNGQIAPWQVQYQHAHLPSAMLFWSELIKYLVGLLARPLIAPAPPPPDPGSAS